MITIDQVRWWIHDLSVAISGWIGMALAVMFAAGVGYLIIEPLFTAWRKTRRRDE